MAHSSCDSSGVDYNSNIKMALVTQPSLSISLWIFCTAL